ncbi:zinc finger CCCH domain-containing protein 15 homolog [Agrilus planipennis]|uniref:Zinc finger CCCH domain-containing protein 15 n=1 Tax=Agrilus planipennis TaxID=224129 RepID=A0A7F5R915_AGRPL|nr:zinc finger CCCH domain-containing protein 15 homolog isoform X1 [Agrilus planipennis]XP_025832455.1 zinc finger CCCH domain-containing protein 15 homolog isoform X2 [Agrilus planipennis]XP_025832456.1 zinc finger CCCH domain-containing protein 15 homolog [Agrilus planipennis]XP_025832457.1 zinc finger CCCH domain-containing protein 15 homolog [Agrilus planipennis]
MPPKKAPAAGPSKKTEQKKKEKVIEDKTFGLKNKKGAKQQKFIQQVEKQVKSGGHHPVKEDPAKKLEREKKLKEQKELAMLFKPVQTQKVEKGADPKSIVCAFFKQGQCGKGDKCKFSHDLTIERKAEKRSLYVDMRDDELEDTMDNWDEEKLKEVIERKHGQSNKTMPHTEIICKHFLEAVEKSKYGWFWQCPSGEKCIYRHALPPGFVLQKDKKKDAKKNEISIEDLIERERAALGPKQTKVTLETFLAWKRRKIEEKIDNAKKEEEKKRSDYKAGRQVGLSGREMFSFNPALAAEQDMEEGDEAFDSYAVEDEDEGIEYKELVLDNLALEAQEADDTGTLALEGRLKNNNLGHSEKENGISEGSQDDNITNVPINENLFADEDLDGLDEELNDLDIDK